MNIINGWQIHSISEKLFSKHDRLHFTPWKISLKFDILGFESEVKTVATYTKWHK